ncbi:MAG TPA: putative Ig domain-containing protein [Steroidobacteraceae bacterium]
MILKFSIPPAPWWRTLLHSLVLGGALCAHAAVSDATTFTLSGTPASSVKVGSTYKFTPTAAGTGGHTVSYAIDNMPSWGHFSSVSGTLTGTPTKAGTTTAITIRGVSGSTGALQWASLKPFTVQVVAAGSTTPSTSGTFTLSGTPPSSVKVGSTYTFTPTASGTGGHTVSYAIDNMPSWGHFSSVSGTLTGTPTKAGTTAAITIRGVTGSTGALKWASLKSFTVQVLASSGGTSGSTVSISGTPATSVTAGSKYSFQPTAKDSAGKAMSYSVQHAPSWATFSIASGLLAGTPTSSQTGVYSGIVISASDGSASGALPAFAITVKALVAATGSATLNWVDPTENTDGSKLTNLAGVNIHYGNSPSSLTKVVQVSGAGNSSYTIANLAAGTWYFGASAYTTAGVEGMMSAVQSKTIH